jgi:hypothetical protein
VSPKELPTRIRVHGRLYRCVAAEEDPANTETERDTPKNEDAIDAEAVFGEYTRYVDKSFLRRFDKPIEFETALCRLRDQARNNTPITISLDQIETHYDWGRRIEPDALYNPIVVVKAPPQRGRHGTRKKYVVLDGQHRIFTLRAQGETTVLARVVDLEKELHPSCTVQETPMPPKELPTRIRVHGRLYRLADQETLFYKAQRQVNQLAHVLEAAADDTDTLKRVLDKTTPGDLKVYDRAAHRLTLLAAPMNVAQESFRRVVRAMVRADIIDTTTASAYFPWIENMQREPDLEEENEGRAPIEGSGVTDYHAPPGTQSVNDTLYPYPLKNLHWSSVPTAIKVKGKLYRRITRLRG